MSLFLVMFFLTGIGYPFFTYKIGQFFFPTQAEGSLLYDGDKVIGSSLIGQNFTSDKYFHSRPSSAGIGYDAENSGASNAPVSNSDWVKLVAERVEAIKKNSPMASIPIDLVTSSGSGLDPDISVAAAFLQAPRVAQFRQSDVLEIEKLITKMVTPRTFGILGEPRVNVLAINFALDHHADSASGISHE